MKNTNTNQTTANPDNPAITADNIHSHAQKIAYVASRTIHKKSGDYKFATICNAILSNDSANQDAQDIIQTAALALWDAHTNAADTDTAYSAAYKAVNAYIYSLRGIRGSTTTWYIEDWEQSNGQIVNIRQSISHTINGIVHRDQIATITAILTHTQKRVLKLMAYGFTPTQIAEKLHISQPTASKHIAVIKRKALTIYPDGIA